MATSSHLLKDISLELRHARLRPIYRLRETQGPGPNGRRQMDFGVVDGVENLAQAVLLRLLTPRGEVAALGHPEYGSRLHELIGARNTETNRDLARLYILEALDLEPRIAETVGLDVRQHDKLKSLVEVDLAVRPAGSTDTVTIGPLTLELEP